MLSQEENDYKSLPPCERPAVLHWLALCYLVSMTTQGKGSCPCIMCYDPNWLQCPLCTLSGRVWIHSGSPLGPRYLTECSWLRVISVLLWRMIITSAWHSTILSPIITIPSTLLSLNSFLCHHSGCFPIKLNPCCVLWLHCHCYAGVHRFTPTSTATDKLGCGHNCKSSRTVYHDSRLGKAFTCLRT